MRPVRCFPILPFSSTHLPAQVAKKLAEDGVAGQGPDGVVLINPSQCLIVLGSIVGCFEGAGLVIPIQVRSETSAIK